MKKGNGTKTKRAEYIFLEDGTSYKVTVEKSGNKSVRIPIEDTSNDGGRHRKKFTAPTLKALQATVDVYLTEQDSKQGENMTYYNACLSYIETRAALAPKTRINYTYIANNKLKSLHSKPVMKLTKADIMNAINEEAENTAPDSMKLIITFLCEVLIDFEVPLMTEKLRKYLHQYGKNATRGNKGYNSDDDWSNAPSPFDIARWAGEDTSTVADRTAISILLDLHSLRSEETRGLRYGEVVEDNGRCYVNIVRTRTVHGRDIEQETTKTEGSTRRILIDRRLYDLIHAQPHQSEDDYIINVSYVAYSNNIKRVIHAHTINGHSLKWITAHKLRHIFKTAHIGNRVADEVGGWSNKGKSVVVRDYEHVTPEMMDKFMTEYSGRLLDAYEGITEPNITVTATAAVAEKLG